MTWITVTSPTLCIRCHVEHPSGSEMAQYPVGPVVRHHRCAKCEQEVAVGKATFRAGREAANAIKFQMDLAREGDTLPARVRASAPTRFAELSDEIKARQARATGER